ncbi:MAG: HEAT repeat domain-containing protein, partial [Planctomycetota bacterium]
TWQHWWDFNQDGHLRLRDAVVHDTFTGSDDYYLGSTRRLETRQALVPSHEIVVGRVLPALKNAVEVGPRDVTVAGMLAMARIGVDHPEFRLFDVFTRRLADSDQSTRETAAIAMGLAGSSDRRGLDMLICLLRDDETGRRATGTSVDVRTRSFAAYGLGLLANRTDSVDTKTKVFAALNAILSDRELGNRDIRTATVQAISLLDLDLHKYAGAKLAKEVLACLDHYFDEDLGVGEEYIQAHCPTAIARLLDREHWSAEAYKERFAAILTGKPTDNRSPDRKNRRKSHAIAQSCALALGQLCLANTDGDEAKNADVRWSRVLLDAWHDHKDAQTRSFALLAIGQIGGAENRRVLLREFDKASANIEQPWCALALGLCCAGKDDRLVKEALLTEFRRSKNPESTGALAVALGLARCKEAASIVANRLLDGISKETMAGALCQGLALLGEPLAAAAVRQVIDDCERRPELLEKAAIALGKLGDQRIGDSLLQRLACGEPNYAMQVAVSTALADVGDRRQVAALVEVLADTHRSAITRAGAAKALGGIADQRRLPWNTPLRANANYRANVDTFTDRFAGVLDLR